MMEEQDVILKEIDDKMKMDIDETAPDLNIFKGTLHPLLIDHIIEEISRHLLQEEEDGTVLQSRLVCRAWERITTKSLRFHSNRTVYFGKYFRNPGALLDLRNYLQFSGSVDHFPIGKFYLCEDVFKNAHIYAVQTFFRDCASLLTSLTIRLDNQSDMKVSDLDFANLRFVNLKALNVDDRCFVNGATTENNSISSSAMLEGFVKCSPNLQRLTVIHLPSSIFDDADTASGRRLASEQSVAQMLVDNCPKRLNYLNLDIKLTDKVLVTLTGIPVSLQELQLSLRESIFSKESLHKLLQSQHGSLRHLRFCSMGTKSDFEISFPILPSLQLLEMHSWDSQVQDVAISKFSYRTTFPSLNSLVLHTWAENPGWIQFFPAAYYGTIPSLTSLKLPQKFMYPAMIQNLSWLYPNLKRLDVHFSKETMGIIQRIFRHFSDNLEELRIRGSLPREKCDFCLDSLFTGLPHFVCERILKRKSFNPDPNLNHFLKLRQQPGLLNLKRLRKLDIEDMLRHETYVTDVTGYLALLEMPSLRYLTMGRSQIDDECLGKLAKRYPTHMEKELQVPKPPYRMLKSRLSSSTAEFLLRGSDSSLALINAYNFCLTNLDLQKGCAIC